MKPVIRSLSLKGFRSFEAETIEFDNPTFLVGQNAAGKSNLVDALAFLQEAMRHPLEEVIRRRGGASSLLHRAGSGQKPSFGLRAQLAGRGIQDAFYSLEIRADEDHSFEVTHEQCKITSRQSQHWFNRNRRSFSSNIEGVQPELDPHFLILPLLSLHDERFRTVFALLHLMTVFKPGTDLMRRPQKAEKNDRLLANWSNAANVLRFLDEKSPDAVARINEILSAITPVPTLVKTRLQGGMASLEFEQTTPRGGKTCYDATEVSDGTLQLLGLLLAVFQRPLPVRTLMVFEEPESFLYPGALSVVTDLLNAASDENQVLVTTHSPELLDAKWITDRHLRAVYWAENSSRVSNVGKASREALREGLMGAGELLRSSVLGEPPVHRAVPDVQLFEALA
jgi:predicted ATPase